MRQSGAVTRDSAVPPPGDLLVQALEGMERPLFVLDDSWRFGYINPAGARALDRRVEDLLGREVWAEFPEALGGPFDELYRRGRGGGGARPPPAGGGPPGGGGGGGGLPSPGRGVGGPTRRAATPPPPGGG